MSISYNLIPSMPFKIPAIDNTNEFIGNSIWLTNSTKAKDHK